MPGVSTTPNGASSGESSEGWSENWEVVGTTAQGAQSWSAKVRNRHDGRTGFLKACLESANAERHHRMRREAEILKKMEGTPGVPRLYEASPANAVRPYVVAEFIDGKRLNDAMSAGEISTADAVSVALVLCYVVEALHAHDIYHRDIKPDNIMVSGAPGTFTVHLVDYGSAYHDDDGFATDVGVELGNRFIRLPEFSSGIDFKRKPQSDLTLIVAVLFYLVAGKKPSVPQDASGAHPHQWSDVKEKLANSGLHRDRLNRVFDTAFQMDMTRRFQSVPELRDALQGLSASNTPVEAHLSVEEIRDRLFTPTESTRQEARMTRATIHHGIQRIVTDFANQFGGTVQAIQGGWQDHPRREATRNDMTLKLARDDRHIFAVRVKAVTTGIETVVHFESEGFERMTLRVSREGLDADHGDDVRGYFQRGLSALLRRSDVDDEESKRLAIDEARALAFEMLNAMGQSVTYYLHQPARDKLAFDVQPEKASVSDDGKFFSVETYMTTRALHADCAIKLTYRARVEIPPEPGERDLQCAQEIVLEGYAYSGGPPRVTRRISAHEDEIAPMRVAAEEIDARVDEIIAEFG